MIELSTVTPDFPGLVQQLQQVLGSKSAWTDRITSSTGQTLVEMLAAIGAYSQFSIESALQEEFPESAKNANSLYAATNFLGVRINRKAPASVKVFMSSTTGPTTISANTQFNGAGTYWFNRDALALTTTPTEVTLYQGQINRVSFPGLGSDFQAFVTTEGDFTVSDTDVFLSVNSTSVPAIQEGLWTKPGLPGTQHLTLPDGRMMLLFGNTLFGSRPGVNDTCIVTYAVTLGTDGANIPTIDKNFSMEGQPTVAGKGLSQASGGGDQAKAVIYKNITPALFGSFNSSVTGNQYKRLPLTYPGVVDAQTFAQREINPRALNWMNVIKVCLLTDGYWDQTSWNTFEQWFLNQTMYSGRIFREDPVAANVDIQARIFCVNLANLSDVQVKVETALQNLFELRQGIIGLDIYRSDIIQAIQEADSNILFVILDSPAADIVLSSFNVGYPVATVVPSGGSLAPGQYDYAVSATSVLGGESAPANWVTVVVTQPGSRVDLQWVGIPNVATYKVWGRQTPTPLGLIAAVPNTTFAYTDTGTVVPTGAVPVQSSIDTYYPNLVNMSLSFAYSNRDKLE